MIHMIFIPCIVFSLFAMLHHGPKFNINIGGTEYPLDISFLLPIPVIPIYFYVDFVTGVSIKI